MPLNEYRRRLGAYGEPMTDEQLIELRAQLYAVAGAMFDWWLRYRHRQSPPDSPDAAS